MCDREFEGNRDMAYGTLLLRETPRESQIQRQTVRQTEIPKIEGQGQAEKS